MVLQPGILLQTENKNHIDELSDENHDFGIFSSIWLFPHKECQKEWILPSDQYTLLFFFAFYNVCFLLLLLNIFDCFIEKHKNLTIKKHIHFLISYDLIILYCLCKQGVLYYLVNYQKVFHFFLMVFYLPLSVRVARAIFSSPLAPRLGSIGSSVTV